MKFTPTSLEGAYLVDLELKEDERGFFSRVFCSQDFKSLGLDPHVLQVNCSFSKKAHTLRGMHFQLPPKEEAKLVRCLAGAIFDVIVDLRPASPTFGKSFHACLTAGNRQMMYVPKGCAHGFLTLEPDTEVLYFVSESYSQEQERGIRWDDPAFAIPWPHTPEVISLRDQHHPNFRCGNIKK